MSQRPPPLEVTLAQQQRAFYARTSASAFVGTVPFRLSTSRAMARLVVHAARRFARAVGKPRVRIVDVGAGTGRLGYHIGSLDPSASLVLTDASDLLASALRSHVQLSGAKVMATPADALGPALDLQSDEALVVVATYLLDTLPHALVQAPGGERASLSAKGAWTFHRAPVDGFTRGYLARLGHGRAFLPVGAFRFLSALERSLQGPALVVLGDKMATSLNASREGDRPRLVQHGGATSVLVNFDALRCWLGWRGVQLAPGGTDDFAVAATVLGGRVPLPGLFEGVTHPLEAQAHITALREANDVVAQVLELEPDGDVVLELADALVAHATVVPDSLRPALGEWLLTAARSSFYLSSDDVPFHAGRVLQRLGFAGAAVACFSESLQHHGDEVVTRLFRAQTLLQLGAVVEARHDLEVVLEREPRHPQALALIAASEE